MIDGLEVWSCRMSSAISVSSGDVLSRYGVKIQDDSDNEVTFGFRYCRSRDRDVVLTAP